MSAIASLALLAERCGKRLPSPIASIWIEINFSNTCFRTALHYAAGHVSHECVELLLLKGSSVHKQDTNGCTPLHYAAAKDADAM